MALRGASAGLAPLVCDLPRELASRGFVLDDSCFYADLRRYIHHLIPTAYFNMVGFVQPQLCTTDVTWTFRAFVGREWVRYPLDRQYDSVLSSLVNELLIIPKWGSRLRSGVSFRL